jgi:hypothetical protein
VKAAATNRPPTTPPTMAGTLALWSVLLLIGLGDGGEVALHNIGFPEYLWHCQKKMGTN